MNDPRLRRALPWLVLLAVLLRVTLLAGNLAAHPGLLVGEPELGPGGTPEEPAAAPAGPGESQPDLSPVGFEASNVARSLVCDGRGFADPFGAPTGRTGWISPGVVALYALPFALFGCFTPASILLVYALGLVLSAAQTALAAGAAERLFGHFGTALGAGLLGALSPFDLRLFAAASTLDLNLHAFLLLLLLYLLLGLQRRPARCRLAQVVVAGSVATLANPVFVAVTAGGLLVALWGRRHRPRGSRHRGWVTGLAALVAAQGLIVGPYLLHQQAALGGWTFVKSNGPFELYLGNRPDGDGVLEKEDFVSHHPSQNPAELTRLQRLGEVRYVQLHGRRFCEDFELDRFLRTTLARTGAYFFGLDPVGGPAGEGAEGPRSGRAADWRERLMSLAHLLVGAAFVAFAWMRRFRLNRGEALVYLLALLYAAPHLLAAVMPRYVLPVTPLALLLGAGAATEAWSAVAGAQGRTSRGVGEAAPRPDAAQRDSRR